MAVAAACLQVQRGAERPNLRRAFSQHQVPSIEDAPNRGGASARLNRMEAPPLSRRRVPVPIFRAQRPVGPIRHRAKRHWAKRHWAPPHPASAFRGVQASLALRALALRASLWALTFRAPQASAVARLEEQPQEQLGRRPFPQEAPAADRHLPGRPFSNSRALALSMQARSSWDLRSSPASPDVCNPVVRL